MFRVLIVHSITPFFPATDGLPGLAGPGFDAFVRRFLRESSWLLWLGTVLSVSGFVLSPVATVYWPVPSFLLPSSVLDRHARNMSVHGIYYLRQFAFLLKMIGGLHWGATPEVRRCFALEPYPDDPDGWRTV